MPVGLSPGAAPAAPRSFDYAAAAKESVACPLCGTADFEPMAGIDRYAMGLATVGCRGCGLIQTNPRLTAAELATFYRLHYRSYYQGVDEPSQAYVRQMHKDARLEATVRFLAEGGALADGAAVLDVGCSEGTFFAALRRGGFVGRLLGVEPNPAFRAYAAARHGAETVADEADLPPAWRGTIGLVAMIHVLEHVADPVATLARLRGFLAADGLLYVDVPDAAEYGTLNDLHIAHIYHFGEATLRATLAAAGFAVVRLEAHRPAHHPRSLRALARPLAHPDSAAADLPAAAISAEDAPAGEALAGDAPAGAAPADAAGDVRAGWLQVRRIDRKRHRRALKRVLRSALAQSRLFQALRRHLVP